MITSHKLASGTLGLIFLIGGLLSVSALLAPAANAQSHWHIGTEEDHVTLTGESHQGVPVMGFDGRTLKCKDISYTGTLIAPKTVVSTIELTPNFTECILGFFEEDATIDTNGCTYVIHTATYQSTGGGVKQDFEATFEVACPKEQSIEITTTSCDITVQPKNGLQKVTIRNSGIGKTRALTIEFGIETGIKYEEHKTPWLPGCVNNTVIKETGMLTGNALVTAEKPKIKEHVGIWATPEALLRGLFEPGDWLES